MFVVEVTSLWNLPFNKSVYCRLRLIWRWINVHFAVWADILLKIVLQNNHRLLNAADAIEVAILRINVMQKLIRAGKLLPNRLLAHVAAEKAIYLKNVTQELNRAVML